MMTGDRKAELLRAALASGDDGDLLVYADWLEENGELPRADLIRAQCVIARHPRWDRRAVEASWRVDELLARFGDQLRADLPQLAGIEWLGFERGVPSAIRARDVVTLYGHAAALAAAGRITRVELMELHEPEQLPCPADVLPDLRVLRLAATVRDVHPTHSLLARPAELEVVLDAAEGHDWLAQRAAPLRRLAVEGEHTAARGIVDQLAAGAWSRSLVTLELGSDFEDYNSGYFEDPQLRVDGARALAVIGLPQLTVLDVDGQRIGDDGFAALEGALPALRELSARACELTDVDCLRMSVGAPIVRLDLANNTIGDAGARVIADSRRTGTLEFLDVSTCELGHRGVAALVEGPAWHTLRYLDLSKNPLDTSGVTALAAADKPAQLHTLALADVDLVGPEHLLAIAWLDDLIGLDLSSNDIGDPGLTERLARTSVRSLRLAKTGLDELSLAGLAPLWQRIVHLDLSLNPLGETSLAPLVASGAAAELQTLALRWCSLGEAGFAQLAGARCPKLRSLVLAGNRPRREGIARLLASPLLDRLEVLDLASCELTDAILGVMITSPRLRRVRTLNLRANTFGQNALVELARCDELHHVAIQLSGRPWGYPRDVRDLLLARFGRSWHDDDPDE